MKRTWIAGCVLSVSFLTQTAVWSQEGVSGKESVSEAIVQQLARQIAEANRSDPENRRAEDMEILASIVHENVDFLYAAAAQAHRIPHQNMVDSLILGAIKEDGDSHVSHRSGEPLVEYLPDYGIVIQMLIPSPQSKSPSSATNESESKPLTRWEQTRRRLHGEEAELLSSQCGRCHGVGSQEVGGTATGTPLSSWGALRRPRHGLDVGDTLALSSWFRAAHGGEMPVGSGRPTTSALLHMALETLAENGHNLRDLAPHERIMISLNYSLNASAPTSPQSADKSDPADKPKSDSNSPKQADPANEDKNNPSDKAATLDKNQRDMLEKWLAENPDADKAKRHEAVRRAYLDLLGRLATPQEVAEFEKDNAPDSYARLVDRLLRSQESAAAAHHAWRDIYGTGTLPSKKSFPNRARLTVSATKEQLDKVAKNELSLPDFMRQVQVRLYEPK